MLRDLIEERTAMPQNTLLAIAKALVGATWLIAAACFFAPLANGPLGSFGRTLFVVLSLVHAVECVVFLPVLRRSKRPLAEELVHTFLFGVVHVSILRKQLESGGGRA
jgi:uncharacterized protein YhhL (DUF1145 family)